MIVLEENQDKIKKEDMSKIKTLKTREEKQN